MRIRLRIHVALAMLCSLLGIPASSAAAAEADQPISPVPEKRSGNDSVSVEEVVVTAQKRTETASRVGLSIVALGNDALLRSRITDTKDLASLVPGFTAVPAPTQAPIYTIRGVGFNTPNMSSTSPVGVYVNDAAYAYPFMTQQTAYDLDHVEVLKGPQGTLYGRNRASSNPVPGGRPPGNPGVMRCGADQSENGQPREGSG